MTFALVLYWNVFMFCFTSVLRHYRVSFAVRVCVRDWWWASLSSSASRLGSIVKVQVTEADPPLLLSSCYSLVFAWTMRPPPSLTSSHLPTNNFLYRYTIYYIFSNKFKEKLANRSWTFLLNSFSKQHHTPVTPVTALCAEAREAAQKLLNHYVKVTEKRTSALCFL